MVKSEEVKSTKNAEKSFKMWKINFCGRGRAGVLNFFEEGNYKKPWWIATVNPEFMVKARKDREFLKILQKTDMNVVDGIGIIWAKELLNRVENLDEKGGFEIGRFYKRTLAGFEVGLGVLGGKYKNEVVAGSKLMDDICQLAAKKGEKVFFLGGFEDRALKTQKYFENKYKGLIARSCSGKGKVSNEEVLRQINEFKPDYLLVAYGMKKQEEWIDKNLDLIKAGVVMGVGRSFDYYSGELKQAPEEWRRIGLEWLYSLIQEPKRWKRQLALPEFIWKVLTE
jgi:N-acetylglucosaminyldiphosphoundecaprenol N-acetyl-beta-D-mannosaminyltransferase